MEIFDKKHGYLREVFSDQKFLTKNVLKENCFWGNYSARIKHFRPKFFKDTMEIFDKKYDFRKKIAKNVYGYKISFSGKFFSIFDGKIISSRTVFIEEFSSKIIFCGK